MQFVKLGNYGFYIPIGLKIPWKRAMTRLGLVYQIFYSPPPPTQTLIRNHFLWSYKHARMLSYLRVFVQEISGGNETLFLQYQTALEKVLERYWRIQSGCGGVENSSSKQNWELYSNSAVVVNGFKRVLSHTELILNLNTK